MRGRDAPVPVPVQCWAAVTGTHWGAYEALVFGQEHGNAGIDLADLPFVAELIDGAPDLSDAQTLLSAGALVWLDVNITFSLLYWELDGGGSAERLQHQRAHPDLAFPQHINPDLAPPGWRARYLDYLYLGFTNATAFSPTDVMPLARWAKLLMATQAILSIVILSLVVANAVNLLGN